MTETKTGLKTADGYFLNALNRTEPVWEVINDPIIGGMLRIQERIVVQFLDITDEETKLKRLSNTYFEKDRAEKACFRHNKLTFKPKVAEVSEDVKSRLEGKKSRVAYSEQQALELVLKVLEKTNLEYYQNAVSKGLTLAQIKESLEIQ